MKFVFGIYSYEIFPSFSVENSFLNFVHAFRYTLYIVPHIVSYTITHAIFIHLIVVQDIP